MMNREKEVLAIYQRPIDKTQKIRLLEDLVLDMLNELEAQDQNMHPEIHHKLSEGLMLAKNLIRELQDE
ncbi:MAG: hypothetical protein Q8R79_04555 [Legionellaceae bacterium]|nr:hypothetical protein [Legionellaceae bacterium]